MQVSAVPEGTGIGGKGKSDFESSTVHPDTKIYSPPCGVT